MAYAAVNSLKQTIYSLLNSSHTSLLPSTREILESAYNDTASLQRVLEILDSNEKLDDDLEGRIRDCAYNLEDVVEFHELNAQDEKVREESTSFAQTVKKMEIYVQDLSKEDNEDDDDDGDDDADVSSNIYLHHDDVEMVGNYPEFESFRDNLVDKMRPVDLCIFSFFGRKGTGITAVANTIFQDLRRHFDCWAWVKMKMKMEMKEVVISILAQVDDLDASRCEVLMLTNDVVELCIFLYERLEHRRYMIVLDDVHDVELVQELKRWLPDQGNGSLVLLTTSIEEVVVIADNALDFEEPQSLFDELLWLSIRAIILECNDHLVTAELEEAGKKIVENCGALSVSAAKTFLFLQKTDKSVEQWSKIAADKHNDIFMVADELSEISDLKSEIQFSYMDEELKEFLLQCISMLVDFSAKVEEMKMIMQPERFFSRMQITSLFGMAGIGKSVYIRRIFKDESILSHFDHHVWLNLGPKYKSENILIDILACIYPNIDKLQIKGDEMLVMDLCAQLSYKRCLIVLDDLWSKEPLHLLKNLFPDIKGITLVTTRLAKVAKFGLNDTHFEMKFLDEEESWCLLCQKVFGKGLCPIELEKAGRKIAENCDGLPLLILTVANQLLKAEISEEYWNNVATGKEKSIFINAHCEISKALLPSYKSLPQYLKACFLYMGIFREKCSLPISKITSLLISEVFLEPSTPEMMDDFVAECLLELVDESLLMVQRKIYDLQIKTCRLHSVFWHLSNSEATKNEFFHAMNYYNDCSRERIKSQRRLCFRNSILLVMKDVQESLTSNTSAHSLLCVNPFQHYPVPIDFELRLLRVMDALTIRLYDFPVEIMRLVHLRYIGLTCNGKLHASISNLWKLQYLIVKQYINVKSVEDTSSLPVEIWDMKELKHLEIIGGVLPNPKCGANLPKLSTLLDVSAQSCTTEVLEMIPNLKRLSVRIELTPADEGNSFHYLNNISRLSSLESLKCVVVNPQRTCEFIPPPAPISMFPPSLKKLSLSGLGYPWEYMSIIGDLEDLEVLKLKHYAFQGSDWEMDYKSPFFKLKFLSIKATNMVHWKVTSAMSMKLERLSIKHCYKLKELPTSMLVHQTTSIEIMDCNRLTVAWAEQMGKTFYNEPKVYLSWMSNAPIKNDSQ